jgi:deoxycytidine triphosphate deaminase
VNASSDEKITDPQINESGILIRDDIERLGIIVATNDSDKEERCYKHASYDLRLGDEYALPDEADGDGQLKIRDCSQDGLLTIRKFGSAIVSTFETVSLPPNVAGRFNLRIRHALEGLTVQMGTQVEPGYQGRLFALIQNISEHDKTIKYKDYETRPFTIEFCYTSGQTVIPHNKNLTLKSIIPVNYAKGGLSRVLKEQESIQKDIRKLAQGNNIYKLAIFTGITIACMIAGISIVIPLLISKLTVDRDDLPLTTALSISAAEDNRVKLFERLIGEISQKQDKMSSDIASQILKLQTERLALQNYKVDEIKTIIALLKDALSSGDGKSIATDEMKSIKLGITRLDEILESGGDSK